MRSSSFIGSVSSDLVLNATKPDQLRYNLKLALAFGVTAVCGLALKKMGWELPETLLPVILSVAGAGGHLHCRPPQGPP
ncbi:MAG: hypothetical protein R3F31_21705 [Verrucomicrobiales bacterium]